MPKYYEINEEAARRANDANSHRDYKHGSATSEYHRMVDKAYEIAGQQKQRVDPMYHEKLDRLTDLYAQKMADWHNRHFSIEGSVPSVLIAGGSNFPTSKKNKQNEARERHMQEYEHIQELLNKIKSTGTGGISSDDPDALVKLRAKLAALENDQAGMKAANAHYRKQKTMAGYDGITQERAVELDKEIEGGYSWERKPYPSYLLTNNNANIRRIRERITEMEKRQDSPTPTGWTFDGGEAVMNTEENRLQILFEEKPDEELRAELKRNGFRWAPSQGAWQRQLTDNALYSARRIKAIEPSVPSE